MRWFLDSITIDLITEIPSTLAEHFLVFDIIHAFIGFIKSNPADVGGLSDKLNNVQCPAECLYELPSRTGRHDICVTLLISGILLLHRINRSGLSMKETKIHKEALSSP